MESSTNHPHGWCSSWGGQVSDSQGQGSGSGWQGSIAREALANLAQGMLLMEILVVGDVLLLQKTILHNLLPFRPALHSLNITVLPRQLDPNSARNDATSAWTCFRELQRCIETSIVTTKQKNRAGFGIAYSVVAGVRAAVKRCIC